ncbi:MAG: GGDEF domain-containing protein [Leptolinea sp.]|jgi:diguanylate cyclase (GGDEF)-like protein|nr:GGDEF domain-containing protein [Leptolinea sp.]
MHIQPVMNNQVGFVRLQNMMEKALLASSIGHLGFILLFLWLGIREMVIVNIISSICLLTSVVLASKKVMIPAFVIGTSEIVIHAALAIFFIGWNCGFHYYLVVLIPFIYFWPSWTNRTKLIASFTLFIAYALLFLYTQNKPPLYQIPVWQSNLVTLLNILIAFVTFTAVAKFYQSLITEAETNLLAANERLSMLAKTDPLTELHNRRTIFEKMGEVENCANSEGKHFSIIIADIDHFKDFNDRYGHQFGDQVLISIAKILQNATRTRDVVSRWGGEEFLILLPDTNGDEAREVADRMRIIIDQTSINLDRHEIHISMTFGVAECGLDEGLDSCINLADKALYEGKNHGRNQVVLLKTPE